MLYKTNNDNESIVKESIELTIHEHNFQQIKSSLKKQSKILKLHHRMSLMMSAGRPMKPP